MPSSDYVNEDRPPLLRDRSPRPYFSPDKILSNSQSTESPFGSHVLGQTDGLETHASLTHRRQGSGPESNGSNGSESGTEADDERPRFLRALPPATLRPRKGLKHSDGTASPLLTPTQLDSQGRRLSQSYFDPLQRGRKDSRDDAKLAEERRIFATRRRAERIRRLCEAALLGFIGLCMIHGVRLWRHRWPWYLIEVLSQISAIAGLVAFYPLRLVSLEHDRGHLHIWSRFRVPPSFDPATVLYPTFVPVLVSLVFSADSPEMFIPNLILGLASLPPRLFPAWARDTDLNTLHWMVSFTPAIFARGINLLTRRYPQYLGSLQGPHIPQSLSSTTLALLFPLHQTLIPAIHYLTTSSLLPAEKQMLSTTLINLLLFAQSPQMNILRSVLWIGGMLVLVLCTAVLGWNVALARVPTWRLRDFRRTKDDVSLPSQVMREITSTLSRLFKSNSDSSNFDSDADEDDPRMHQRSARSPSLVTSFTFANKTSEPLSAIEPNGSGARDWPMERRDSKMGFAKRRNTIASPQADHLSLPKRALSALRRHRQSQTAWTLSLTTFQATLRKRMYATYIYTSLVFIVLWPVRVNVAQHALDGREPFLWAIDYLLSGLPLAFDYITSTPLPSVFNDTTTLLSMTSSIPALRLALDPANLRLLIILHYLLVLMVGLTAVLLLSPKIEVDTRRKIFHAIMVAMFLPTIYIDPCFCALALGPVLAVFLILEVIRAGQVPPLGTAIGHFVAPYVDGRDLRGPMVVSHVFLLIGCAIPFWLSLVSFERVQEGRWKGWELVGEKREAAMLSGVVCVGMGDAAASLIGRRYGRRKWPWIGGKSLEGSAAFAGAVVLGLSFAKTWLRFGGWEDVNTVAGSGWVWETTVFLVKASIAGCGASFLEAVLTGANDNVMVPVALWLFCRGLRI